MDIYYYINNFFLPEDQKEAWVIKIQQYLHNTSPYIKKIEVSWSCTIGVNRYLKYHHAWTYMKHMLPY